VLVWDSGSSILNENSVKMVSLVVVSYSNRTDGNRTILPLILPASFNPFILYCDILYPIEVKISDCYEVDIMSNK
jgi:hypothetical protein